MSSAANGAGEAAIGPESGAPGPDPSGSGRGTPDAGPIPLAIGAPVRRWGNWAWALPVLAVIVVVVLAVEYLGARGPEITVRFGQGHGIKPGDALKHRGVVVGQVTTVRLAEDLERVEVKLRLHPWAQKLAVPGSQFWIERPQVSLSRVRGLDTVLGPRYLAVLPGASSEALQTVFDGLAEAPVLAERPPGGLDILLEGDHRRSLARGAPLVYRGVQVGRVLSVGLASDGVGVEARAYVDPAYRQLVRENTRFWNSSGIDLNVGFFSGFSVDVESLETIATGGISLATPTDAGPLVTTGHRFRIHSRPKAAWLAWRSRIPIGSALLPGGGSLPQPLRASLRWTGSRLMGLGTKEEHREGWVLPLDSGRLLGPADLLLPASGAKDSPPLLSVAGRELAVSAESARTVGSLALYAAGAAGLAPEHPWPRARIRHPAKPEDCLLVGDPQADPMAVSVGRLAVRGDHWQLDAAISLDPNWHGASVVSRADGKLIGILLVQHGRAIVVPVPADEL